MIVNRLNKTKKEVEVDHESERQARLRVEGARKKAEVLEQVSGDEWPCFPRLLSPSPQHQ